jgi:hypothetical protein
VERVLAEAKREGARVIAPPPGVSVEPTRAAEPDEPWWPVLPWQTAQEHPVRSGNVL